MKRTWQDIEALARDLSERYPGINPLAVSLRELRDLVVALPTFGDTPEAADDQVLEAIQAAWYEVCEE